MPTTGSTRCLQTGIIIRAYIVDQRWLILNGQECICVRSLRSKYNDRDDDRMVQARLNILCWIIGTSTMGAKLLIYTIFWIIPK